MRIWSIHPAYLDTKGLVALWRETLLAKNVLEGNTKGYKNHPQLIRFKSAENPIELINQYLSVVFKESLKRGYHFNKDKFNIHFQPQKLTVTQGQLNYEMLHLLKKLKNRDLHKYHEVFNDKNIVPHPVFEVIEGPIEVWEIV
jgi:hypothetical protein